MRNVGDRKINLYNNLDDLFLDFTLSHVNFCVSSLGCAELTSNLIKSCNRCEVPIVVFALDDEVPNKLEGECAIVPHRSFFSINSAKFYNYGSPEFGAVIFQRFLIGNELLKHKKTFTYLDVDVVVKKDFQPDILSLLEDPELDAVFQENPQGKPCSGFYSFKSTQNTVNLFTKSFLEENDFSSYSLNQPFLNEKVFPQNLFTFNYLNKDKYPTGRHYYDNEAEIDPLCLVIHFNGVIGETAKIAKMKKYGYWFNDD